MRLRWLAAAALVLAATSARAQEKALVTRGVAKDFAVNLMGTFSRIKVIGWKADSMMLSGFLPKGYGLSQPVFGGNPGETPRSAKLFITGPEGMATKGAFLELYVPIMGRVFVRGGSAEVIISNVNGEIDVNMLGGTITVDASPRTLNVEAVDASITFTGAAEWARLRTDAGDIAMRGKCIDAAFTSISGNVRVIEAFLDRARFESTTGNLTFIGELAKGASVTFDGHSGTIDVQLAGKPDATIDAFTLTGAIENLMNSKAAEPARNGRGQAVEVQMGLGYGRVDIKTYKGNIRLSRK